MTATNFKALDDANHFENQLHGILKNAFDSLAGATPETEEHRAALTLIENTQNRLHGFMRLRRGSNR